MPDTLNSATRPGVTPAVGDERPARTAGISGLGRALPRRAVPNEVVARRLGVDEAWIERRTGITSRYHADPDETLVGLATAAGAAALEDAGLDAAQLDLILVATVASDDILPNAGPLVAHALGVRTAAMDIGAACTGFLAALALAAPAVETGRAEHVLVIGAETLSRYTDHDDKRTAPLFGDGAGAAVLSAGAGAVGPVILRSDGGQSELITASREHGLMVMQGHETFVAAVAGLAESTRDACAAASVALDEVDLFVYHQANRRILTAVAEELELEGDRLMDAIAPVGNTSAASVPLTLCDALEEGRLRPGDRVLLGAAGAGFTYGAAVIEWERA